MSGTITSANNGGFIPHSNGFEALGPFNLHVLNGATISAELQIQTSQDSWIKAPSDGGFSDINAGYWRPVDAAPGERFRIAVTTATGTWDWGVAYR